VFLKKFDNALMTNLKQGHDVMGDSVWRWDFDVGSSSCKKFNKFSIFDNKGRPVALHYPLDNVSTINSIKLAETIGHRHLSDLVDFWVHVCAVRIMN